MQDLGAKDKPTIMVFNKIDAYTYIKKDEDDLTPETKKNLSLNDLERSWMANENYPCIFISAGKKINIDEFKDLLYEHIKDLHVKIYPHRMLY